APLLTMMAGLAAHEAIRAQTGAAVDLKWPNDLLIGGKKIGGVPTEMHAEPSPVKFVIVGLGINGHQGEFPGEVRRSPTTLRVETGRTQSRLELLVRLLREFESGYNRFLSEGASSVVERFAKISSYTHGKRVRVTNGRDSFAGVTAGLSPEGLLLVKQDG